MTYDELNAAARDEIVAAMAAAVAPGRSRPNYGDMAVLAERLLRELSRAGWTVTPPAKRGSYAPCSTVGDREKR